MFSVREKCYARSVIVSVAIGVLALAAAQALSLVNLQPIYRRNFWIAVFWMSIPFSLTLPIIHLPSLVAVRWFSTQRSLLVISVCCGVACGLASTAVACVLYHQARIGSLTVSDISHYLVYYCVTGAVLGLGFACCHKMTSRPKVASL